MHETLMIVFFVVVFYNSTFKTLSQKVVLFVFYLDVYHDEKHALVIHGVYLNKLTLRKR